MIWVLCLLAVPVIAILAVYFKGQGRITGKELLTLLGKSTLVCALGVCLGLRYQTTSTEVWNGRVAHKDYDPWTSCCHCRTESYNCGTNSDGSTKTCHRTVCDHSHDQAWTATSTNDELVYNSTCNSPLTSEPERWTRIRVGEPTAFEHRYTNYIRANPDSLLHNRGLMTQYAGRLPEYPRVFDEYRVNHFVNAGVAIPGNEAEQITRQLDEVNANLGAMRQVNITLVVTRESNRNFADALREFWMTHDHGAEKNDFTVVIGMPDYPEISWVEFVTWTRQERVKTNVRDRIEGLHTFNGAQVVHIIGNEVDNNFVRRPMADYEYLYATVSPPWWSLMLTIMLEVLTTYFLARKFWFEDPFDRSSSYSRRSRWSTSTSSV